MASTVDLIQASNLDVLALRRDGREFWPERLCSFQEFYQAYASMAVLLLAWCAEASDRETLALLAKETGTTEVPMSLCAKPDDFDALWPYARLTGYAYWVASKSGFIRVSKAMDQLGRMLTMTTTYPAVTVSDSQGTSLLKRVQEALAWAKKADHAIACESLMLSICAHANQGLPFIVSRPGCLQA